MWEYTRLSSMYSAFVYLFFFNDTATTEIYTLSLHDALPICECIRAIHSRVGLQYLSHRCHDRTGVSQQYGARWRALPHYSFAGQKFRLQARRREEPSDGWLPHVLRDGQPQRVVSPVAHRNVRQSNRGLLGRTLWREDQLRPVDRCRVDSGVDDDRIASPHPLQVVSTRRYQHSR